MHDGSNFSNVTLTHYGNFSSHAIRETGELQVLSAHHQSGGVSTFTL